MEKLGNLEQIQKQSPQQGKPVSLAMAFMSLPKDVRLLLSSETTETANEALQKALVKLVIYDSEQGRLTAPYLVVENKKGVAITEPALVDSTAAADLVFRWATAAQTPSPSTQPKQDAPAAVRRQAMTPTRPVVTSNSPAIAPSEPKTNPVVDPSLLARVEVQTIFEAIKPLLATYPSVSVLHDLYGRAASIAMVVDDPSQGGKKVSVSLKLIIRHHGRFLDVIRKLEPFGVHLSQDELRCLLSPIPEDSFAATTSKRDINTALNPPLSKDQQTLAIRIEQKELITSAQAGWDIEDISTFYQIASLPGDGLPPPPPENFVNYQTSTAGGRTSKELIRDGGNEFTGVFTPQMLVPIVPTYFVPVELVVAQLPEGYTIEHIESLFMPTNTIEMISLGGQRFIRLHGGLRYVDMMRVGRLGNSYSANMCIPEYAPYRPTTKFAHHIASSMKAKGIRPWQWVPLRTVLTQIADPAVIAEMPFQRYQSLVYVSEMQHLLGFSPAGEGEICYIAPLDSANLTADRSPIPSVVNELNGMLTAHQSIAIETLIDNSSRGEPADSLGDVGPAGATLVMLSTMMGLSAYSRDLLLEYYDGDLKTFFLSHKEIFTVAEETNEVQLTSTKRLKVDKDRSLEARLEDAYQAHDRKRARKIRRQMARQRNPDNPLFDSDRFAEELARFLPRNTFVTLRSFMKNVPPELFDLFPAQHMNPFRNNPKLFKIFEFKQVGKLFVCRPEVPLPEGHLKMSYNEAEIIQLTAAVIQTMGNRPQSIFSLFGRLPWFAREQVRTVHKGLFELLKNYPQYFLIVFRESVNMDARSAHVSLVATPPVVMDDSPVWAEEEPVPTQRNNSNNRRGGNNNNSTMSNEEDDPEMAAALAEVRQGFEKAGYSTTKNKNFDLDDDI